MTRVESLISQQGASLEEKREIFFQKNRRYLRKIKQRLEADSETGSQEKHQGTPSNMMQNKR